MNGSGARPSHPSVQFCFHFYAVFGKNYAKQECIPVGCVPPAAVAVPGGHHQPPQGADPPGTRHSSPRSKPPPGRPAARHAGIPPAMHAGIAPPPCEQNCGAHDQPVLPLVGTLDLGGRFDIEDTRATRRSRYRRTSKLRIFEVGTLYGVVTAVSYLCGILLEVLSCM